MTKINRLGTAITLVGAFALGGCETMTNQGQSSSSYPANPAVAYSGMGVVESVDFVSAGKGGIAGSGIGVGAIAGAVIGGVLGNQVGSGTGQTVATVAGAAGGAYAGNELEKRQQGPDSYRITVRMDSGSYQTLTQSSNPDVRVGDRVRVDNGMLRRQ